MRRWGGRAERVVVINSAYRPAMNASACSVLYQRHLVHLNPIPSFPPSPPPPPWSHPPSWNFFSFLTPIGPFLTNDTELLITRFFFQMCDSGCASSSAGSLDFGLKVIFLRLRLLYVSFPNHLSIHRQRIRCFSLLFFHGGLSLLRDPLGKDTDRRVRDSKRGFRSNSRDWLCSLSLSLSLSTSFHPLRYWFTFLVSWKCSFFFHWDLRGGTFSSKS